MSRTRLSAWTALALVVVSAGIYIVRRETGGAEVGPAGVSTWEVTLTVHGRLPARKDSSVATAAPPDFRRQHIFDERWHSDELLHREGRAEAGKTTPGRDALWKSLPAAAGASFRLTYTFRAVLGTHRPTPSMHARTNELDAAPTDGTLKSAARIESDAAAVGEKARELTESMNGSADKFRALFDFVAGLPSEEPEGNGGALDCLRSGGGDESAKSRLLVALCRNRGIPARVITGLVLNPDSHPTLHRWVEAWISGDGPEGHWLPADPTYEHFGTRKWPVNYLVMRLADEPLARGATNLEVNFFARHLPDLLPTDDRMRGFWQTVSFSVLPPAEQQLVRFLVLLPPAVLIICLFRVVVGVPTYGMFSPALLGLIFRDLKALPWGLGIFAGTVVIGWLFRRVLDRYHLLLIPRAAVLLSLIVVFLLVVVVVAAHSGVAVTNYIALFPLIILTHMVERFWTVEAEDGTRASFKTLLGTGVVASAVSLALGPEVVSRWVFRHPESLGVVIAALLLLGRYTGYRISELYRFQDLIEFEQEKKQPPPEGVTAIENSKPTAEVESAKTV